MIMRKFSEEEILDKIKLGNRPLSNEELMGLSMILILIKHSPNLIEIIKVENPKFDINEKIEEMLIEFTKRTLLYENCPFIPEKFSFNLIGNKDLRGELKNEEIN
jgi:hypothetical protein